MWSTTNWAFKQIPCCLSVALVSGFRGFFLSLPRWWQVCAAASVLVKKYLWYNDPPTLPRWQTFRSVLPCRTWRGADLKPSPLQYDMSFSLIGTFALRHLNEVFSTSPSASSIESIPLTSPALPDCSWDAFCVNTRVFTTASLVLLCTYQEVKSQYLASLCPNKRVHFSRA